MLTRRMVLECFSSLLAAGALLPLATAARSQPAPLSDYTVTLPNKRILALPPFATESLPKSLTFRVRVQVQDREGEQTVRLFTLPAPDTAPAVTLDATLTAQAGVVRRCDIRFGTRGGGKPSYTAEFRIVRASDGDEYTLTLPTKSGSSPVSGVVLHPLSAQLLLGRQYDFKTGGRQTFAVVQEWNGDALSPATDLATLVLQADGAETLTLAQGKVKARRLRYTLSAADAAKEKIGTFFIGPKGELLQSTPPLWGIPFDGGTLTGAATQNGTEIVCKTTSGETIKGRPVGDGYTVELYGKPDYPFVVASVDVSGNLRQVSERWNGREKVSTVRGNEVRYRFSEGNLAVFAAPDGRADFAPLWFATSLWEGKGAGTLLPGATEKAVWVPLWLRGEYSQPATFTRLPDVAQSPNSPLLYHHYRWQVKDGPQYDLYTDGARMVALRGSDGLLIVRDDSQAFALAISTRSEKKSPDPVETQPEKNR